MFKCFVDPRLIFAAHQALWDDEKKAGMAHLKETFVKFNLELMAQAASASSQQPQNDPGTGVVSAAEQRNVNVPPSLSRSSSLTMFLRPEFLREDDNRGEVSDKKKIEDRFQNCYE